MEWSSPRSSHLRARSSLSRPCGVEDKRRSHRHLKLRTPDGESEQINPIVVEEILTEPPDDHVIDTPGPLRARRDDRQAPSISLLVAHHPILQRNKQAPNPL